MTGSFTLHAQDRNVSVTASLRSAPIVTAGYGGWSKIARPRRKALTEWNGRDPVSLEWDFLIDNLLDGRGLPVERDCRALERIAGLDAGDPEPPLVTVASDPPALMPHGLHRAAHVKWFIEELSWDEEGTIYNRSGNRVRATGRLVLTQYVEDEHLEELSPVQRIKKRKASSKKGKKGKSSRAKTYTVKRGDTLSAIAARKLGKASRWREIAKLNGIRDPRRLKVGKVLKLP